MTVIRSPLKLETATAKVPAADVACISRNAQRPVLEVLDGGRNTLGPFHKENESCISFQATLPSLPA